MTINSQSRIAGPFTGTGVNVPYPANFKVFQASDFYVSRTSSGVAAQLVLSVDYTVSLNSNQDTTPGGVITLLNPLAVGDLLTITSVVPATQPVSLTNTGGFYPRVIEDALDRVTILLQQNSGVGGFAQSLRVPEIAALPLLPSVSGRADLLLGFDSLGNPIAVSPTSGDTTALAANLANSALPSKGAGQVGLGAGVAYADQSLGDQALSIRALRKGRTEPHANFAWFTADFTVAECQGPGRALLAQDVADVFQTKFGASIGSTVSYVHPQGSDANGGTSWRDAFLTLNKALRLTTNGTIFVWPGTYDLCDFRYTDSYGGQPKKIIAPFAGVTLRTAGDDPTTATWSLSGVYGGVYQVGLATTNVPMRVLRKDLLDKYGEPTPMPYFGTLVALSAVNFGWAYDAAFTTAISSTTTNGSNSVTGVATAGVLGVGLAVTGTGIPGGTTITAIAGTTVTLSANSTASGTVSLTYAGRMLYVRDAMSANVNTTTKANLQVIYGDATGDTRTLLYSTTSYWENITFLGYISVLKLAGQAIPQFWAKKCTFKYANTHSMLVEGGYCCTQDCRAHRQAADGANYNTVAGTIARGLEVNFTTQYAGDVDTYGSAMTLNPQGAGANKNGSSNHDSYVVRVNGSHTDPYGPNIADTATSYSWNLGVTTGYNQIAVNSIPINPRYGILNQANSAWCDGCSVTGSDTGFNSDSAANVRTFNCFGTLAATSSGVFTPYVPT